MTTSRFLTLGLTLASFACEIDTDPELRGLGDEVQPRDGELADEVCPAGRQIARRESAGACGPIGPLASAHWAGEPLFGDDATGELERYCLYSWTGVGEPSAAAVAGLGNHPSIEATSSDCRAITPEADAITDALQWTLRDIFHTGVGRADDKDLGLASGSDPRSPVTVAVIDTMPGSMPAKPRSRHGETMARIVGDLACPGSHPSCVVEIDRVLGLPRWEGGLDPIHGGVVGTFSDLARAIDSAVESWKVANAGATTPSRLIINLSIGWEPVLFGGDGAYNLMDPAAASVYAALATARCTGALVIAATGNDGGLCNDGPMLPAGWETRPAPSPAQCAALGVTNPVADIGSYRPLVYAVGGTDIVPGEMPESRVDARPRLVATATHAVAGDPPTPGLTGTSIAAAAASGAAAAVWAQAPNLAPSQVMQLVYGAGELVPGATSQVQLVGRPPQPVRRLDVCAAVDAACATPGVTCSGAVTLGCLSAPPLALVDDLFDDLQGVPLSPAFAPSFGGPTLACAGACDEPDLDLVVADGVAFDCDTGHLDPALRLTHPQPGSIACPTCTVSGNVVTAALDPSFGGEAITSVSVSILDTSGKTTRFDLGAPTLGVSTARELLLDASRMPASVRSASITIGFDGLRPTTDPLIAE